MSARAITTAAAALTTASREYKELRTGTFRHERGHALLKASSHAAAPLTSSLVLQSGSLLAAAAPKIAKVLARATPAVMIATTGYNVARGAIDGYAQAGSRGAMKGAALGAADTLTFGLASSALARNETRTSASPPGRFKSDAGYGLGSNFTRQVEPPQQSPKQSEPVEEPGAKSKQFAKATAVAAGAAAVAGLVIPGAQAIAGGLALMALVANKQGNDERAAAAQHRTGSGAFMTPQAAEKADRADDKPTAGSSARRRAAAAPATRGSGPVQVAAYRKADGSAVAAYSRQRGA